MARQIVTHLVTRFRPTVDLGMRVKPGLASHASGRQPWARTVSAGEASAVVV
jgi:hypothetical protein